MINRIQTRLDMNQLVFIPDGQTKHGSGGKGWGIIMFISFYLIIIYVYLLY